MKTATQTYMVLQDTKTVESNVAICEDVVEARDNRYFS